MLLMILVTADRNIRQLTSTNFILSEGEKTKVDHMNECELDPLQMEKENESQHPPRKKGDFLLQKGHTQWRI